MVSRTSLLLSVLLLSLGRRATRCCCALAPRRIHSSSVIALGRHAAGISLSPLRHWRHNPQQRIAKRSTIPRGLATDGPKLRMKTNDDRDDSDVLTAAYAVSGLASALSWTITSIQVLSFHPDPRFAHCSLRHNALTIGQALLFPLSIGWAVFASLVGGTARRNEWHRQSSPLSSHAVIHRRLNVSLALASLWLAASSAAPSKFAFGYDLIPAAWKFASATVHAGTGLLALAAWIRSATAASSSAIEKASPFRNPIDFFRRIAPGVFDLFRNGSLGDSPRCVARNLFALSAAGMLWLSVQPILASYPLATIPTILGKRLSRPASAFSFLASTAAYCCTEDGEDDDDGEGDPSSLRRPTPMETAAGVRSTLARGLQVGSGLHLGLVLLKLIGIDGGGLLLRGRGLWEVYPAMMAVPFALGASLAQYAALFLAASMALDEQRRRRRQ